MTQPTPKSAARRLGIAILEALTTAVSSPWVSRGLAGLLFVMLSTAAVWWGGPAALDLLRSMLAESVVELAPGPLEVVDVAPETPPVETSPAGADREGDAVLSEPEPPPTEPLAPPELDPAIVGPVEAGP